MKVAAITITKNRLALTKATMESFYSKTNVDYHLFIDNGSTDGTREWLAQNYDHIRLDRNYGIAAAFAYAVSKLPKCDYILKLDNDLDIVTEDIIEKMVWFLDRNPAYAVSPMDLNIESSFFPVVTGHTKIDDYNLILTHHTGGAFQLASEMIVKKLCDDYVHLAEGDWKIGLFYRKNRIQPAYLSDLEMRHVGMYKQCDDYKL